MLPQTYRPLPFQVSIMRMAGAGKGKGYKMPSQTRPRREEGRALEVHTTSEAEVELAAQLLAERSESRATPTPFLFPEGRESQDAGEASLVQLSDAATEKELENLLADSDSEMPLVEDVEVETIEDRVEETQTSALKSVENERSSTPAEGTSVEQHPSTPKLNQGSEKIEILRAESSDLLYDPLLGIYALGYPNRHPTVKSTVTTTDIPTTPTQNTTTLPPTVKPTETPTVTPKGRPQFG